MHTMPAKINPGNGHRWQQKSSKMMVRQYHRLVLMYTVRGLRNDPLCVEWDVKPYTLTHSFTLSDDVRLATARDQSSQITGLNGPHGSWVEQEDLTTLTLYRAVASDRYISKCSMPSRSNLHFQFLTFGHSGAQGWAPECPNVRN